MNSAVVCVPSESVPVLMKNRHWGDTGFFNELRHKICAYIPDNGPVIQPRKNRHLERLRKAENVVYDLYNNGLYNRRAEAVSVFNLATHCYVSNRTKHCVTRYKDSMYCVFELLYNMTLLMASAEQKLITRNEFNFYRFTLIKYCQLLKVQFGENKVYDDFYNF